MENDSTWPPAYLDSEYPPLSSDDEADSMPPPVTHQAESPRPQYALQLESMIDPALLSPKLSQPLYLPQYGYSYPPPEVPAQYYPPPVMEQQHPSQAPYYYPPHSPYLPGSQSAAQALDDVPYSPPTPAFQAQYLKPQYIEQRRLPLPVSQQQPGYGYATQQKLPLPANPFIQYQPPHIPLPQADGQTMILVPVTAEALANEPAEQKRLRREALNAAAGGSPYAYRYERAPKPANLKHPKDVAADQKDQREYERIMREGSVQSPPCGHCAIKMLKNAQHRCMKRPGNKKCQICVTRRQICVVEMAEEARAKAKAKAQRTIERNRTRQAEEAARREQEEQARRSNENPYGTSGLNEYLARGQHNDYSSSQHEGHAPRYTAADDARSQSEDEARRQQDPVA